MKENGNDLEDLKYSFTPKLASLEDVKFAEVISTWTKEAGTMLPKTPEEIVDLFLQDRSVIVVNALGEVVSHAAAAFIYADGSIELGALVTGKEYKSKGAATLATKFLLEVLAEKYPDKKIFALANSMSSGLFQKLGAEIMDYSLLGNEVWENCAACPKNPSPDPKIFTGCCDTPYGLTNIALGLHHS